MESFERIVGCLEMNHGLGEIEAEFHNVERRELRDGGRAT